MFVFVPITAFNITMMFFRFNTITLTVWVFLNGSMVFYFFWFTYRANRTIRFRRKILIYDIEHQTNYYENLPPLNTMLYSIRPLTLEEWCNINTKTNEKN